MDRWSTSIANVLDRRSTCLLGRVAVVRAGQPARADAPRTRRAILAATERLLATHRPQDITMEQVAAAAGGGKGTIFHPVGNPVGVRRPRHWARAARTGSACSPSWTRSSGWSAATRA